MLNLSNAFAVFPVLETERFILRAVEPGDAAAIFTIMSDQRVLRYLGRLPMATLAEADEHVQAIQAAFEEQSGVRWAIALREGGELLGSCGYWRLMMQHDRAEIGYELAPAWWGKQVMSEVLAAVLGFGFTNMGLHSVEAQIHPANTGSRRVLEKLGFVQEGYFRENYYDLVEQRLIDTAVFSLLHAEWRNV